MSIPAKIPPGTRFFEILSLALCGALALAFAIVMPPLQVPDEHGHFVRAYMISRGQFVAHGIPELPEPVAAFVGGMNVRRPSRHANMNATSPLARLSITDEGVVLGLRGPLRRLYADRHVDFELIRHAQLVEGVTTRGVCIRLVDEAWYFWTYRPTPVVAALSARGVVIRPGSVKPRFWSQEY